MPAEASAAGSPPTETRALPFSTYVHCSFGCECGRNSAAPDGDEADLHALAFDHRAFGGGIGAADRHAREFRDIEKEAAVARLGRTLVFRLWLAHAFPFRPSPSARARAGK